MKVYVLSTGAYSNWSIEGIFSTREKAEEFINIKAPYWDDYNDIQEHELDPQTPQGRNGKHPYEIQFSEWDTRHYKLGCNFVEWDGEGEETITEVDCESFGITYYIKVWAKDIPTAIKIASDRKAQYLANKEGI